MPWVDGHRITTIDADTMSIGNTITIPERVFNLAYDKKNESVYVDCPYRCNNETY